MYDDVRLTTGVGIFSGAGGGGRGGALDCMKNGVICVSILCGAKDCWWRGGREGGGLGGENKFLVVGGRGKGGAERGEGC